MSKIKCRRAHLRPLMRRSSSCRRRREVSIFLQKKFCIDRTNSMASRHAHYERRRRRETPLEDDSLDRNDTRTMVASIHYMAWRQKDLAGASPEFDVRQKSINHAT
ncbi:hypothetical protein [Bradyrhizobium sp. WSM2254]|uniref:hypothetical protein n=1 Tax=Bradyrhizobium sp. WSM2254 TaxID=1188263 RepID=UPI0018DC69D5|nr:hypothetical protein [Bradyrhizobium sp. WSM2254]